MQILGVSEKQWETWVEMEIAQYSVPFNCRKYVSTSCTPDLVLTPCFRCHHSGFVDRHDLEAQSEIHCPFPVCDHVWCKRCQQTIEPGGAKHSCDGTAELDHLMKQQGWRYCPSEYDIASRVALLMTSHTYTDCKTPIQKIQGCNHLSVRLLSKSDSPTTRVLMKTCYGF